MNRNLQFPSLFGYMHLLQSVIPCAFKRASTLLKGKEKREQRGKKRERGAPKAKEGSKKLQILTLPPKWPRSGVTFHFLYITFE